MTDRTTKEDAPEDRLTVIWDAKTDAEYTRTDLIPAMQQAAREEGALAMREKVVSVIDRRWEELRELAARLYEQDSPTSEATARVAMIKAEMCNDLATIICRAIDPKEVVK